MPINRYQIRNVYSLADPELYKAADKDDPEALLEGVAMAGLVGVLRQLGDLAEFAAEIFHDLHEEVMATAARGHGLLTRVQQLESEFPSIERAFLSQTCHSKFFPNSGIDWHPNRQTAHNLITTGDLPRFVMDSYEECRGPPRLFLLDKFDVGGAGACLKRYTDPSVFKVEASSYEIESAETQRDKKIRKPKKKGSRWKGGETQEVSHVKLHQLFLEERVQNGAIEPARLVKLKKRPNKLPFDLESGESYMNTLLNSPEDKLVHEVPVRLSTLMLPSDTSNGSRLEIPEDSMAGSALGSAVQSSSVEKIVCGDPADSLSRKVAERKTSELPTSGLSLGTGIVSSTIEEEVDEKQITVDEEIKTDGLQNGYLSDDVASETDDYMDALATMESQLEPDAELRAKTDPSINQGTYSDANIGQFQSQLSDSQSVGNSIASDDGNDSIRKGVTTSLYSDTTSTSTENTLPVGIDSPPQPFACTEIPFHPRVPPKQVSIAEKIMVTQHSDHNITNDTCVDVSKVPNGSSAIDSALHVDQVRILEEGTSKEADSNKVSSNHNETLSSPRKNREHQIYMEVTVDCTSKHPDFLPTADSLSSMSFVEIPEGEVDDKHGNDRSSPMIHLPIILDTTCRMSENSLSEVNQVKYEEDNHSTGSVDGHCSSSHSVILHVDEQPFATSLAECDIDDLDVKPSDTTSIDDVPVAEVAADNPDIYSKKQFKEIADDILHISDLAEAIVPYSSEAETESNNAEIELMAGAVSDVADANRSGGNDLSVLKDEAELEEREIGSVKSEVKVVGSNPVSVPDDLDINEGKDLLTLEDDAELEAREVDSINLEVETRAAVLLPIDVDKHEGNGCSTLKEPDASRSVIDRLCNEQDYQESGKKEEVDQLLVISPDLDYISCDTAPYDSSSQLLLDSIPDTSLSTCDDLNDDVDSLSLNSKILQDRKHSFLAETDQNGLQEVILHGLSSPPGNIASCDPSDVQLLDSASSSIVFTEANHDIESKSPNHGDHDKFEAAKSSPEDNANQPNDQLHELLASEGSQMLLQLDSLTHVDHEKHFDSRSEPYLVNNATQSVVEEEDLQRQLMDVVVATHESTHIQDMQSSTESVSIPVSGNLQALELLQVSGQEVNHSAQVKHQSTPVFSGFGILPQLTPVKPEDMPPLPPLPPMQWRMRKPQNALLTPTDSDQHSDNPFPSMFPCKADEGPQVVGHPTLDETRNPDTENQKSKHAYEDLRSDTGGFSQMLLPEASLHTEDHDKSSVSSEAKFAENLMPVETEHSHSVPTTSGRELFWPSSNPYSFHPVDDEVPNTIRPIKVQRPRTPLIDAVAAHDKSKLRKVSDRATPEIPKGEESDAILEQIRAKSFNLKPAVQTRPSIQGPKTNLRVAAILEKANAIRQAFAGSDDDDDDSDSWSDS
ncbi:hypothetical protein L6452_02227 [Arctium lappa]|uniref:Uncharacterized protein n=1 Tax=Arctium lappa TaxID=4217 RepID=A0ACB9FIH6_ARCLA|nr:hypothetical protein L6452_02227 [Arctium lappa]